MALLPTPPRGAWTSGRFDDLESVDAVMNFRSSVAEKCESMRQWYDVHGELTAPQMEALENMIAGARRWLR